MPKREIYDGEISVEGLRNFFQEKNDFTNMPTWDVGELNEDQAEFREWILGYLNKSWNATAKKKGMKYQSWKIPTCTVLLQFEQNHVFTLN